MTSTGEKLDLPSIRAARAGNADFAVERWPDGTSYFTGFSKSDGYRSYPGLRWIVLVREDQKLAFAPVRSLQRNIAISGAVFAALSALLAWALAETLSRPLLQLADVGRGLAARTSARVPGSRRIRRGAVLVAIASVSGRRARRAKGFARGSQSVPREPGARAHAAARRAEHRLEASQGRRRARDRGEIALSGRGEP